MRLCTCSQPRYSPRVAVCCIAGVFRGSCADSSAGGRLTAAGGAPAKCSYPRAERPVCARSAPASSGSSPRPRYGALRRERTESEERSVLFCIPEAAWSPARREPRLGYAVCLCLAWRGGRVRRAAEPSCLLAGDGKRHRRSSVQLIFALASMPFMCGGEWVVHR